VCGALITEPAPLGISLAIDWLGLTIARWTLGVLNFNFKKSSLVEVTKLALQTGFARLFSTTTPCDKVVR
jgi:hypothetical protein